MMKSERIVRRDCMKDFLGPKKLPLFRHLIFRDVVFKPFTQILSSRSPLARRESRALWFGLVV